MDFSLNHSKAKGASILVGRNNFGCGSSREHAVWAVAQQGFRVVIAPRVGEIPGFADIFKNNCSKNGILAIELSDNDVNKIFEMSKIDEPLSATVDLENQKIIFDQIEFIFEIDISVKDKLLSGMDDIAESLSHIKSIEQFETSHNTQFFKINKKGFKMTYNKISSPKNGKKIILGNDGISCSRIIQSFHLLKVMESELI